VNTRVIHCKGNLFSNDEVSYIGRPSLFGNPYSHKSGTLAQFKVSSIREAIAKYKDYFDDRIKNDPEFRTAVLGLRGKKLSCWCVPHSDCHGFIIKDYLDKYFGDC
jgi:hypothetical protein